MMQVAIRNIMCVDETIAPGADARCAGGSVVSAAVFSWPFASAAPAELVLSCASAATMPSGPTASGTTAWVSMVK